MIPKSIRDHAALMAEELAASCLEVMLVPSPIGADNKIRLVTSENPAWYRSFCACYESNRGGRWQKFKTRIKRRWTLRALRLIARGVNHGIYVARLMTVVEDDLARREREERAQLEAEARAWRKRRRA